MVLFDQFYQIGLSGGAFDYWFWALAPEKKIKKK